MTRHPSVIAVAVLFLAAASFADESLWTDEERADLSTAVFTGRVLSVARVEELNEREDLHRAIVAVEAVSKGAELIGMDKLALYFEHPKSGQTSSRCPTYVAMKEGDRANFFVRSRKVGVEWRAFLDMGSDVRTETETRPAENAYPSPNTVSFSSPAAGLSPLSTQPPLDCHEPIVKVIDELTDIELAEAREARDQADLLAAAFEDRYRWMPPDSGPDSPAQPNSPAARKDYEQVVTAYRGVIEKYPLTEVAAYTGLRLSGFHQYCREFPSAIRVAQEVANSFQGSFYEARAYFVIAMIEPRGRNSRKRRSIGSKKSAVPPNPQMDARRTSWKQNYAS